MGKTTLLKIILLAVVMVVGSMSASADIITITGADMSTTDGTQAITKSGIGFNGFMKQYQTTKIWFTSGTGYIYNSTSLGSINKITLSYNVGGSASSVQRFNVGNTAMSSYMSTGGSTVTTSSGGTTYEYTGGSGFGFFNISVSNKNLQLVSIVIDYTPGSTLATAAPTFSPSAGNYTATQNVSLTSATPSATIYYTTDGTDPDNTKTQYTTPISVSTTTTIKARAFATGMDPSTIASATYTFPIEVSNIATLRAITLPSTQPYKLTGEAVLTLKTTTRNSKYIQDGTGAVLIDDPSGIITTTYNYGDGIMGITGTLALYNNMLQFTPVTDPGPATSTGNMVTPVVVTLDQLTNYQGYLVTVRNVLISDITGGTGVFTTGKNFNLNGSTTTVLRTHYADLDYINTAIPTTAQNITGVVLRYNSTDQLVPRALTDFEAYSIPTITITETTIPAMTAEVNATDTKTINVGGSGLTENINLNITGADAAMFGVSPVTITLEGNAVPDQFVTITYKPTAAGSHNATLEITSIGVDTKTMALTGSATDVGTGNAKVQQTAKVWVANGKIMVEAAAGEAIEIYNAIGQKLVSRIASESLNEIDLRSKGVHLVKVSNRVARVLL